jgi:large subunit ribosomal protein L12
MEYVYGALVLHAAGKPVNEENLKKVLTAAGVKVDETRVKALTAALEGVNIDDALKSAIAMPTAAPAATAPTSEKKDEKKKEEKKEEEKVSEEEAAAGLGALFGL